MKVVKQQVHSIMKDAEAGPSELVKIIMCGCNGSCGAKCSCRKGCLKCTSAYINVIALNAQIFQTLSQKKTKLTYKEVFLTLLRFTSILSLINLQLIEVDTHDILFILITNMVP